jgi:hypothetical protein
MTSIVAATHRSSSNSATESMWTCWWVVAAPTIRACWRAASCSNLPIKPAGCVPLTYHCNTVSAQERLPTPFGLVRTGVAPDHGDTKVRTLLLVWQWQQQVGMSILCCLPVVGSL